MVRSEASTDSRQLLFICLTFVLNTPMGIFDEAIRVCCLLREGTKECRVYRTFRVSCSCCPWKCRGKGLGKGLVVVGQPNSYKKLSVCRRTWRDPHSLCNTQ